MLKTLPADFLNLRPALRVLREFNRDAATGIVTKGLLLATTFDGSRTYKGLGEVWLRDVACFIDLEAHAESLAANQPKGHAHLIGTGFAPQRAIRMENGMPVTYNPRDPAPAFRASVEGVSVPVIGMNAVRIRIDADGRQSMIGFKPVFDLA